MSTPDVNLASTTFLLADRDSFYRSIVRGILLGFGVGEVMEAGSAMELRGLLSTAKIDALILDENLKEVDTFSFVKSLRMDKSHPRRSIPIVLTMSTVMLASVNSARESGCHIVVKKPISPKILYDRLAWISSSRRPFWESDVYYGPDRRARSIGRIAGNRRQTDVSQNEIDELFQMAGQHAQAVVNAA